MCDVTDFFSILKILGLFFNYLLVMFVHEFAHAFVAYKSGDDTPKFQGRVTINPLRHIDPVGLMCCAFFGFGWARPVPVDPRNFKKGKREQAEEICSNKKEEVK